MDSIELPPDLKELCASFIEKRVKFIVIGGFASVVYGVPRMTGDIDLWIQRTQENAMLVLQVLDEFGFGSLGITLEDLLDPDMVIQLGYPPARIDLLTFATGLEFDDCYSRVNSIRLSGLELPFLSREDLLLNKTQLGRSIDLVDVERIQKIEGQ